MRLKNLAVSLLALSASTAFAGGDHGGSFQTATTISNGVTAGRIGTAGDVDFFKLVVRSTSNVNLYTTGDSDTVGTLFNSRFSLVTSNDDASGSQNFRIAQQLTAGTYYLSVKLYNSRALGAYDLRIVGLNSGSIPIPTPPDDHANSTTGATVLAPNSSASGILTAGDVDYFLVNVQQSGRLVIRSTGGTDTFGTLISPSGPNITNDDTNGRNFELSKQVAAGRYFVAVRHRSATGTGNYGITSTFTPAVALTPPSLIAPLNNTTVNKDNGSNFSWSTVAGATGYRLVISQNADFTGYSASTGTCSNSTCAVFTSSSPSYFKSKFDLGGQQYHWRVQALNGSSSSGWSRIGSFTTTVAQNGFDGRVDSFVRKKKDICTDMDGLYGCQCVDLVHSYLQDVFGIPRSETGNFRGNAYPLYLTVKGSMTFTHGNKRIRLDKIANTTTAVPQKGDIIFWSPTVQGNPGHVAIFIEGDASRFKSLDQNWFNASSTRGSVAKIVDHTYTRSGPVAGVVGWLRPVVLSE